VTIIVVLAAHGVHGRCNNVIAMKTLALSVLFYFTFHETYKELVFFGFSLFYQNTFSILIQNACVYIDNLNKF
jgi:hypothetical protein